jgi:hypothetical protein
MRIPMKRNRFSRVFRVLVLTGFIWVVGNLVLIIVVSVGGHKGSRAWGNVIVVNAILGAAVSWLLYVAAINAIRKGVTIEVFTMDKPGGELAASDRLLLTAEGITTILPWLFPLPILAFMARKLAEKGMLDWPISIPHLWWVFTVSFFVLMVCGWITVARRGIWRRRTVT